MRKTQIITYVLLLCAGVFINSCQKKGCTDPDSVNFDPEAVENDGSCSYETSYTEEAGNLTRVRDFGDGTGTMTWTNDKTWLLDGFVFVNAGQTLTIEPGTVIKGTEGQGSDASALVVATGGKIMAEGTVNEPIIFTAEADDVVISNDIPTGSRGLWGGVIVLGEATLNSQPGTSAIEGLPTTETRGIYGGTNDADNSGVLTYVSIRYGGSEIGSGNEINGLTLAGVGSGTTVDYVEVIYNKDDGFEFFGGTVGAKHLVSAFCGDDAFDYDEGFRGKGQFWFVIQDADNGDRGGEHDGGTSPEDGTPYATPSIWNATYIGRGESAGKRTITFRDNAGGTYMNSIFVDYADGIDIELLSSGEHSWKRFTSGDLNLGHNVFHNVAANDAMDIFTISTGTDVTTADSAMAMDSLKAYFGTAGNMVLNPGITISRTTNGMLDPIPTEAAVLSGAMTPTDSWFDSVDHKGAFGANNNWLKNWTFLDAAGYLN